MRIGFRADGDQTKGTGHLMRCAALAAELARQGNEVCFYCSKTSAMGIQWLHSRNILVETLPVCNTIDEEAALLKELLQRSHTDVIIIDSYWLNESYFTIVAESEAKVVAIDDSVTYRYTCDMVINGNLGAEKLDYSNCTIKKLLLGSQYSILRPEFTQTSPSVIRQDGKKILVTMGGADVRNFTPTVIRGLEGIPEIKIEVVYGPLMRNKKEIENAIVECATNCTIIEEPSSMAQLMADCDIAISAGGGSTRELFCMGTPTLFVLQADNQLPLQTFLEGLGLGSLCLGYYNEVTPEIIQTAVKTLIKDWVRRQSIQDIFLSFNQRMGLKNIVQEITFMVVEAEK